MAGLGLAAAGALYSRLGGADRRTRAASDAPPPAEPHEDSAPSAEVERARSELAEELARRAGSD